MLRREFRATLGSSQSVALEVPLRQRQCAAVQWVETGP